MGFLTFLSSSFCFIKCILEVSIPFCITKRLLTDIRRNPKSLRLARTDVKRMKKNEREYQCASSESTGARCWEEPCDQLCGMCLFLVKPTPRRSDSPRSLFLCWNHSQSHMLRLCKHKWNLEDSQVSVWKKSTAENQFLQVLCVSKKHFFYWTTGMWGLVCSHK